MNRILIVALLGLMTTDCAKMNLVPEAQRSPNLPAVQSHLDFGGTFYLYMDIKGDLEKSANTLNEWLQELAKTENEDFPFDVRKALDTMGLQQISAIGLSSVEEGRGFRNKGFISFNSPRTGLLRMWGTDPHAFEIPTRAPDNADLAFESDLDLKALFDVFESIVKDSKNPELQELLLAVDEKIPGLSLSYRQLIDRLNTRILGVLRLNPEKGFAVPGLDFQLPSFDFILGVDGLSILFDALQEPLKNIPFVHQSEDPAFQIVELSIPLPIEIPGFRLALVKEKAKDRVFIASHLDFLKTFFGEKPSLQSHPDFTVATSGFCSKGNSLSYMSSGFINKFQTLLDNLGTKEPDMKFASRIWMALLPDPNVPVASMHTNLPDGVLFKSNATSSHKQTLLLTAANPWMIGVMAAVAIPSFIEYKRKAEAAGEILEESDQKPLPDPKTPDKKKS